MVESSTFSTTQPRWPLTRPPADVEHLDCSFEFVLVECENIGVGVFGQHHGVPLEDLAEGRDVVADPGGPLVVQFSDGGSHVLFQPRDEALGFAAHEGAEVLGQGPVLLRGDAADAGRRALVDVAEQARPATGLGALEDTGAAAAHREHTQQGVHGFPDGTGRVRTEVARALPPLSAHHLHARAASPPW